jgi:hypothetical protein
MNFSLTNRNHLKRNNEASTVPLHRRRSWLAGMSVLALACAFPITSPALAAPATEGIAFGRCAPGTVPAEVAAAAECGSIVVPVDRAKPEARRLTLPILRFPSQAGSKAEPLFVLNGGPGEANLAGVLPLGAVQRDRDIY